MLFIAFSKPLPRDFLAVSPIPGLRSGSNTGAFFIPHSSGVIISAAPIGAGLALIRGLYSEFADV